MFPGVSAGDPLAATANIPCRQAGRKAGRFSAPPPRCLLSTSWSLASSWCPMANHRLEPSVMKDLAKSINSCLNFFTRLAGVSNGALVVMVDSQRIPRRRVGTCRTSGRSLDCRARPLPSILSPRTSPPAHRFEGASRPLKATPATCENATTWNGNPT